MLPVLEIVYKLSIYIIASYVIGHDIQITDTG